MEHTDIQHQSKNRITGLDMYRIIACALVIINHCNSKVMIQVTPKSLAWFVTVGVFYITKVAVPGFFMIAGYNLLHRQDTWDVSWKRIKRILLVLIVFSLGYYVWKCAAGKIVVTMLGTSVPAVIWSYIWGFVSLVWRTPVTDAYWYLYTYLGLMIMLPFLQKLVGAIDKELVKNIGGLVDGDSRGSIDSIAAKNYKIFLGFAFVFVCLIPSISVFIPAIKPSSDFELPIICCSVCYMVIGHLFYLYNRNGQKIINISVPTWLLIVGFGIGFAMNMLSTIWEWGVTGGEEFLSMGMIEHLPLALESLCLFTILLRMKYSDRMAKIIVYVASATFGMYLLADFMCTITHMVYYYLCPYMNRLMAVAIQDIVALGADFAVVMLLRKVPGIKKLL